MANPIAVHGFSPRELKNPAACPRPPRTAAYTGVVARGLDKHKARLDEIASFGKDLARRAQRKCELCEESDDLRPHDTEPDQEPSLDTLVLLCSRCREVTGGRDDDARTLRFLEGAVWSEVPVVASVARAMLVRVDASWARDTLELIEPSE